MMNSKQSDKYLYKGCNVAESDAELEEFFQILFEPEEACSEEEAIRNTLELFDFTDEEYDEALEESGILGQLDLFEEER